MLWHVYTRCAATIARILLVLTKEGKIMALYEKVEYLFCVSPTDQISLFSHILTMAYSQEELTKITYIIC